MELIVSITGILSVWTAGDKKNSTWIFSVISCSLLGFIFYENSLFSSMYLQIFYIGISLFGLFYWKFDFNTIEKISWFNSFLLTTVIFIGLSVLFDNVIDALGASLAITATILLAIKDSKAWLLYIISNLCSIYVCITAELYLITFQYIVFLIISIIGYEKWTSSR